MDNIDNIDTAGQAFDLQALWEILKNNKRIILSSLILLSVVLFGISLLFYNFQGRTFITSAEFSLNFDKISEGKYPDNSEFSTSDILNYSILSEVYRKNNLSKLISFSRFKDMITISQTNDELALLGIEYSYKYYEPKLALSDRLKLDELFQKKRRNAQKPVFIITITENSRFESLSQIQKSKIIKDMLDEYARYASRLKGANIHHYALIGTDALEEIREHDEQPLIMLDKIQLLIDIVLDNISSIKRIPGSSLIKIREGITIHDLEYYIRHLQFMEIVPSAVLAKSMLDPEDLELNYNYIMIRLNTIELEKAKLEAQQVSHKESLLNYISSSTHAHSPVVSYPETGSGTRTQSQDQSYLIPQFSSSFVENIMDLFREDIDSRFVQDLILKISSIGTELAMAEYRIDYYNSLLTERKSDDITGPGKIISEGLEADSMSLLTMHQIVNSLSNIIIDMNEIYSKLKRLNLRSESILYRMTKPPYGEISYKYSMAKLFIASILMLLFLMSAIITAVLLINSR